MSNRQLTVICWFLYLIAQRVSYNSASFKDLLEEAWINAEEEEEW